jgi:MFS family permease
MAGCGLVFVGTIVFAEATTYTVLLLGRALVGAGNGMTYLSGLVLILALSSKTHVARLFSLWEAVGIASLVVHTAVGGMIVDRWGWRVALWCGAVVAAVSIAALSLGVRRWPPAGPSPPARTSPPRALASEMAGRSRASRYALILITSFTLSTCWTGMLTVLLPLYGGNVLGLTATQIGGVLSAAYLVDVILLLPAGYLMDRCGRTVLLLPALAAFLVASLLLSRVWSFGWYSAVAVLFASGFAIWNLPSTLVADLRLGTQAGFVLSLVRFVGDAANIVSPVAVGFLVHAWGYQVAAWGVAALVGLNLVFAAAHVRGGQKNNPMSRRRLLDLGEAKGR